MDENEFSEKMQGGLTLRSLIIGVILVLIYLLYADLGAQFVPFFTANFGDPWAAQSAILYLFIVSVISSVFLKEKYGFTYNELLVIYVMSASVVPFGAMVGGFNHGVAGFFLVVPGTTTFELAEWARQYTPSFMCPPYTELEPMLTGGSPIPWGSWTIPLLYWFTVMFSFYVFNICLTLILSHHYIREERLAYPFVDAIITAMGNPKKPLKESMGSKLIWIGIPIGFLFQSTFELLQLINPAIPELWPKTAGGYAFDLGPLVGPAQNNVCLYFPVYMILTQIFIWFMASTSFLIGALVGFFVYYWIIPGVETVTGMVPNLAALGIYGTAPPNWAGWGFAWVGGGGILLGPMKGFFIPIGVSLGYLILSRSAIIESIKAAVKGERVGAFSDRLLWIGLLLSLIVFIAMWAIAEASIIAAIMYIVFTLLIIQYWNRARGEAPIVGYDCWLQGWGSPVFMFWHGEDGSLMAYRTEWLASTWNMYPNLMSWHMLEGLRLADMTKTKWSHVVIASVIGFVITTVGTAFLWIWGGYTYGFQAKFPSGFAHGNALAGWWYMYEARGEFPVYNPKQWPWMETIVGLIVGIAFPLIIYRFPSIPISPIGFVITGWDPWYFVGMWFPAALALILRVLILKTGGTRLYRKVIPLALGIIIGHAICQMTTGVITLYRGLIS